MKRLLSMLMVLLMVLSMGVTVFADEDTGSITITNATLGDSYSIYMIFGASYVEDANDDGKAEAVSYSIEKDNQFFSYLFGADGTTVNPYFSYDAATGAVTRKENTAKEDIFMYLTDMVRSGSFAPTEVVSEAGDETLVFDDLPFGYYLIDKGAGAVVTITSNTPDAQVIDKNQAPAANNSFVKKVYDEDTEEWVDESTANIGDIVDFKVEFIATNYDGEHHIEYYNIKDTKGSALWVEFDDITVTVGDTVLQQGFYHCANPAIATGEWDYLGTWTDAEDPDNAQWYLIHHGYDEFDIVIPWQEDHDFNGTTNGFTLEYADNAKSIYESPVSVKVEYSASVEPNATIGIATKNELWNTAALTWTSDTTAGAGSSTVQIRVYALGLNKTDSDTGEKLEGAVFELYRDQACTDAVYVIPTNIKGVYILDDLTTIVSGKNRETSRKKYAAYLEAYLGENYETTQKNEVTTAENGKLVVLGLEGQDYYLKETAAPKATTSWRPLRRFPLDRATIPSLSSPMPTATSLTRKRLWKATPSTITPLPLPMWRTARASSCLLPAARAR